MPFAIDSKVPSSPHQHWTKTRRRWIFHLGWDLPRGAVPQGKSDQDSLLLNSRNPTLERHCHHRPWSHRSWGKIRHVFALYWSLVPKKMIWYSQYSAESCSQLSVDFEKIPAPITLSLQHSGPGPTCITSASIYLAYDSPNKKDTVLFTMDYLDGQCMSGRQTLEVKYLGAIYVFMRNDENYFGF